jgi:glucokinase
VTLAVGLDIGGTKILGGVVDIIQGRVIRSRRIPTEPKRGGAAVLACAVSLAEDLAANKPATVGIGICELVSREGKLNSGVTIDWRDLDLSVAFGSIGPTRIDSDVRVAALAESRFGAAKDQRDFLYITIGSGISHCLVVDGIPYTGANGEAIVVGAPPVEALASGPALAARAGVPRAEDALAAPAYAATIAEAANALGMAVAGLVNSLDPALVVFGGGLGLRDDYRNAVARAAIPLIERDPRRLPAMVPARTGLHAGVIGAALVGAGHII